MLEEKVKVDSECRSRGLLNRFEHPHAIRIVNQTITQHAGSLVSPQAQRLIRTLNRVLRHQANSLNDLAKIAQVESIVRFKGRWLQIKLDLLVNLEGSIYDLRVEVGNVRRKFALSKEPLQNGRVN